MVNLLMDAGARQALAPERLEHLTRAVAASLEHVYWISALLALIALALTLRYPRGLRPGGTG